jgi:hypothetical protein
MVIGKWEMLPVERRQARFLEGRQFAGRDKLTREGMLDLVTRKVLAKPFGPEGHADAARS